MDTLGRKVEEAVQDLIGIFTERSNIEITEKDDRDDQGDEEAAVAGMLDK